MYKPKDWNSWDDTAANMADHSWRQSRRTDAMLPVFYDRDPTKSIGGQMTLAQAVAFRVHSAIHRGITNNTDAIY